MSLCVSGFRGNSLGELLECLGSSVLQELPLSQVPQGAQVPQDSSPQELWLIPNL